MSSGCVSLLQHTGFKMLNMTNRQGQAHKSVGAMGEAMKAIVERKDVMLC